MTIVFQGHVESIERGPDGKVAINLYLSHLNGWAGDTQSTDHSHKLTVFADDETAKAYWPGMPYQCTIYPLAQQARGEGG